MKEGGGRLSKNFRVTERILSKKVKRVRKRDYVRQVNVKHVDGIHITGKNEGCK